MKKYKLFILLKEINQKEKYKITQNSNSNWKESVVKIMIQLTFKRLHL